MNSLSDFLSNPLVRKYFEDLDEDEVKQRMMMFLEIVPFIQMFLSAEEPSFDKMREVLETLREDMRTVTIEL